MTRAGSWRCSWQSMRRSWRAVAFPFRSRIESIRWARSHADDAQRSQGHNQNAAEGRELDSPGRRQPKAWGTVQRRAFPRPNGPQLEPFSFLSRKQVSTVLNYRADADTHPAPSYRFVV